MNNVENMKAADFYDTSLKTGKDPFTYLFETQKELQHLLTANAKDFSNIDNLDTLGKKYEYLRDNKIALDSEFNEVVDALPGLAGTAKERSGLWKAWKANHKDLSNTPFTNLSESELWNLYDEYADMFIFLMNMGICLDISAKDLFIHTMLKVKENERRAKTGY